MTYKFGFGKGHNNCVFYYGALHTIGGNNEIQKAIAIFSQFDLIVINDHTGGDIALMNQVIHGTKAQNPNAKFYGYVALGNASTGGSGNAVTNCDRWVLTDAPKASGLIDGIFLDEFGHDFPSGTRDQQNAVVTHCHDVLNVPVFANPWVPTDVFEQIPYSANTAPAVLGSSSTYKDIVLVESFITLVDGSYPYARQDLARDRGRVEYFLGKRDNESKNIEVCCMMGVGLGTGAAYNTQLDEELYRDTHDYLARVGVNWLCVNHGDIGGTSNSFFYQHIENVEPTAIASGTRNVIKF